VLRLNSFRNRVGQYTNQEESSLYDEKTFKEKFGKHTIFGRDTNSLKLDLLVTTLYHHHKVFLGSICTTLGCTPDEFWSTYENDKVATDVLSNNILTNVIGTNHEKLRAAERRYRIDDLLSGMIIHAPHPLGQRYVAVSIHIAHKKGEDAVIDLAKAWMEQLFLPSQFLKWFSLSSLILDHLVLAISKVTKTEPSSSKTPESEALDFRDKASVKTSPSGCGPLRRVNSLLSAKNTIAQ